MTRVSVLVHVTKALRETQTLRAGCSKAEPKKIRPAADPLPGGAGRPKLSLISWRWSIPLPIQTQFGEDRCMQFRVIVVTDPQNTHKQTNPQTGPITIHCAAASAHCKYSDITSAVRWRFGVAVTRLS